MTWLWIAITPIALGIIGSGYLLAFRAIAKRFGFDTESDSFPLVAVGSFVGLLLFLLPIIEAIQ